MGNIGRRLLTYTTRYKLSVKNPFRNPLKKSPLERYRRVDQISDLSAHLQEKQAGESIGPRPTDWAYLAAYIDGEGCVTISDKGSCTLEAASVDPHVLRWISETFGGEIRLINTKARRSIYRWRIYGSSMRQLIPHILPYSRVKGDQLKGVLEYYDYPPGSARRSRILAHMKRKKRYDFGKSRSTPAN